MSNLNVYGFSPPRFRTDILCMLQVFQLTNFNLEFFIYMFTTMIDFHVTIQSASFIFPSVRYCISYSIPPYTLLYFDNCYTDKSIHNFDNFIGFLFIRFISRKIERQFCSFKFLKIEFLKLFHPILFSTSTYVDNANKNHSTPVSKSIKMIKGVYVE